jgi:hypothetical protein
MYYTSSLLVSLLAIGGASAAPAGLRHRRQAATGPVNITAAQVLAIAPQSASCDPTAQFADECRTNVQAAPFINDAFNQFSLNTVGEQAAVLSLMAFETGQFEFDRNHFPAPGNPGQGTRNLMNFPFIYQYALNTTSTAAQAQQIVADPSTATPDQMNAVLALVLPDELSFASGAWFLKESGGGCTDDIVQGLQAATLSGWQNYITTCVGTTVTSDRQSLYETALSVLSGNSTSS